MPVREEERLASDAESLNNLTSKKGRLFIVSGPSGVGKDAVLAALFNSRSHPKGLIRCVTATTRPKRPGEKEGIDYFYLTNPEFQARIGREYFLEHAKYGENSYGTPSAFVQEHRCRGNDVLLKIEVKGAKQVKKKSPDAVLIFLAPPSVEELKRRLFARDGTHADHERRLAIALDEMKAAPNYDYLVVNDDIRESAAAIRSIILAERHRIPKVQK